MPTLHDVREPLEHGIAFMTRGAELRFENGVPVSTGSWVLKVDKIHRGDTVVIYRRTTNGNEIYKAICNAVSNPIRGEHRWRYRIKLSEGQLVGTTQKNWKVFAKTGSNPIKYF